MKLLYGHSDDVIAWVGWRIPLTRKRLERDPTASPFGPAQAIGVLNAADQLVAGVVYHNYDPDCLSVELSFAADTPKWLTRKLICELLNYPFETMGLNRITGCTPDNATSALAFLERFGFKREGVAKDGFGPGVNAVVSRLLKREWVRTKWANGVAPAAH